MKCGHVFGSEIIGPHSDEIRRQSECVPHVMLRDENVSRFFLQGS